MDELLQAELQEGWIPPVLGGDSELTRPYRHTAVGKLGVVVSPDCPPRLVVDSFVGEVTSNTHLPNRAPNPSLSDVRRCVPLIPSNESLIALVLDISKAHHRIRVRPPDQGLLCFRHAGLLVCLTDASGTSYGRRCPWWPANSTGFMGLLLGGPLEAYTRKAQNSTGQC